MTPHRISESLLGRAGRSWWAWAALAAAIVSLASVRLRLESMPLERDEGEYAYAGQLILQGVPPYERAYNMKFPGTYFAYAGMMAVFGETAEGIHRGFIAINIATVILVFVLTRRVVGDTGAAVASWMQATMASSAAVLGLAGHATHLVVVPVLAGLVVLLRPVPASARRLLAGGLCFGLGVLMKQTGAVFLPLGIALALQKPEGSTTAGWRGRTISLVAFLVGTALPHLATWAWLYHDGVFSRFWFWTIDYAREYGSILSIHEGVGVLRVAISRIIAQTAPVWILAAIGLTAPLWHAPLRRRALFLGGWTLVSFLAVCPGLYFRDHYFILLIPALSLLAGAAVQAAVRSLDGRVGRTAAAAVAVILAVVGVAWPVWHDRRILFQDTPEQASRAIYGINPFAESPAIAAYVREHCPPEATIAVIGSEPQIYFYARRRSATGHIYTYGLMEPQPFALEMQREMIREIEAARPEFLIFVRTSTSWLMDATSHREIFQWFERYSRDHYSLVGLVDTRPADSALYLWNGDTWRHPDRYACDIHVWRRDRTP